MSKVVALLCADIHLSHTAPVARSAEPDWYAAQGRYIHQLSMLEVKYQCPILCAGDVFHKWHNPPQLINWAINQLPPMLAVPGQHDLPLHSYIEIGKSSYYTLELADTLEDPLQSNRGIGNYWWLHKFGWEEDITPPNLDDPVTGRSRGVRHIALTHRYIWTKATGYPGAPAESKAIRLKNILRGYDLAVFGDNHQPFNFKVGDCLVYNCGCLIPRSMSERNIKPSVGLLHDDGTVERYYLDCSEDKWVDTKDLPQLLASESASMKRFLSELLKAGSDALDFGQAIRDYLRDNKVDPAVSRILLDSIE